MSKLFIGILVVSIIGNMVGLYFAYKYIKTSRQSQSTQWKLKEANKAVENLTDQIDQMYEHRMIFLHHSVGNGILTEGGLRDSLLKLGVVVKGATYGDEIGQETDIRHWAPKFQKDLGRIFRFKAHPDKYYDDDMTNDIVMFKSCYPNSDIVSEGSGPGDPTSAERTLANYKATFQSLKSEMRKADNKLFIYMTAPPMVPKGTSPEAAANARKFNTWLIEEFLPAYREETGLDNLAIFDLYGFLSDDEGFLKTEYRKSPDTGDSHPNKKANQETAKAYLDFFKPLWETWQSNSGA